MENVYILNTRQRQRGSRFDFLSFLRKKVLLKTERGIKAIMGRYKEKTDILSRDLIVSIKHYCFNNMSEFYERFKDDLPLCRSSFFSIMAGDHGSVLHVRCIEELGKKLNLADEKGGSVYAAKEWAIHQLVKLVMKHIRNSSITSLTKLEEFMDDYKEILKS